MKKINNNKRKVSIIGTGSAGLSGLNGCACQTQTLGRISEPVETLIEANPNDLTEIIKQLESGAGLSDNETFSFEEIDELYNRGITSDEKKAWVFYKRKYRNIPMHGWERYFINLNDQNEIDKLVVAGALFYIEGKYVPYPVYAWGNMYERELEVKANRDFIVSNYSEDVYNEHLRIIQQHKPRPFRIDDEDKAMRPTILPISKLARKFKISEVKGEYGNIDKIELKDTKGQRVATKKRVSFKMDGENMIPLISVFKKWLNAIDKKRNFKPGTHPYHIINYYLDGFPLGGSDRDESREKQAEIKSSARDEGNRLFEVFLNEVLSQKDIDRLNETFNRKYNGWSDLNYAKIPIGFEMSSTFLGGGFAIRPEKREAIAYMEAVGAGILAYDVGVGKTVSALLEMANALHQGKAKRALVVVPNPTYNNWLKEAFGGTDEESGEDFNGILSGVGISMNDWYNLSTKIEKQLGDKLDSPVEEKSVTFITYEAFLKLGFSENADSKFLDELTEILDEKIEDPEFAEDGLNGLGRTDRDDAKKREKINEIIGRGKINSIADIDTLGFDYIVIDEAHRCKNIFDGVSADEQGNKNYNLSGASSTTGMKAFFVCNYIQNLTGGNVMLLTATPFTNSPLEIFSMMSLVGLDLLQQNGYYNLNDFFKNFVKPKNEFVVKQNGDVVLKEVIKGFENIIILQKLIFTKINYKTGDDVGVKRPCKINLPLFAANGERLKPEQQKLTYIAMNEMQQKIQSRIIQGFNNIRGPKDKGMLMRYLSESLNNAFSPYLVGHSAKSPLALAVEPAEDYKQFVENSPKVKYAVDAIATIKKHHEERKESVSGQVIYSNRGIRFFRYIKEWLIEEVGFKKQVEFKGKRISEVMILAGGKENSRVPGVPPSEIKEFIKDAFQAGVIKVLIGSSTIREGINLQKKGTVIYNLYPDWNPTDVRQLEGRIWRQGNKFGFVRMALPLVADTMDVFVFQKLDEKTSRINDIFYREGKSNVLDLDDIDPSEIKYALISDINKIAKIDFTIERKRAALSIDILKDDVEAIKGLRRELSAYETYQKDAKLVLRNAETALGYYIRDFEKDKDGEVRKKFKRAQKLLTDIAEYNAAPTDDKLVSFKIRLRNWPYTRWDLYGFDSYNMEVFAQYYQAVRLKEKQILEPKGYSLTDNFDQIAESVEKEYQEKFKVFDKAYGSWTELGIDGYLSQLKGKGEYHAENNPEGVEVPDRWKEIVSEIQRKKEALRVTGLSPEERVKEFADLNYLLTYGIKDVDLTSCPMPTGPNTSITPQSRKPKASDAMRDRKRRKLRLKAKAIVLLMQMESEGLGSIRVNGTHSILDLEFEDKSWVDERRAKRYFETYGFSFHTLNKGDITDYSGIIKVYPGSKPDYLDWDQDVPDNWEEIEEHLFNQFYHWKGLGSLSGTSKKKLSTSSIITREDYPAIFLDWDGDGVLNADDPNPLEPGDEGTIEEVKLSDEFGKLIDLRIKLERTKGKLVSNVEQLAKGGQVKARSKTPISIINKLIRKRMLGAKGLTDLVGAMLIVRDKKALDNSLKQILSGSLGEVLEHEDFYKSPLGGYRAHHFIIEVDGIPSELQLKTERMKKLAAASHTPYKNGKLNVQANNLLSQLADKADRGNKTAIKQVDRILKDPTALEKRLTK